MLQPKDFIPIVAALIALCGAAVSVYVTLRGQRRQYFADMRKWADEASDALAAAVHTCELKPIHECNGDFSTKLHDIRIKLSSLIDRGRWFFPNIHHLEVGVHKEEAFRGLRTPVLDQLVYAYRLVGQMSCTDQQSNLALREPIVQAKRRFVSEIQNYLDPRNRRATFSRLTKRIKQ